MAAIQFFYLTLVRTILTWSNIEKVNGDFMLKNPLLAPSDVVNLCCRLTVITA